MSRIEGTCSIESMSRTATADSDWKPEITSGRQACETDRLVDMLVGSGAVGVEMVVVWDETELSPLMMATSGW